jgi:crotonobetainyl-CoA:carnitine CoA-transferase CaiB-like acyl-CoA transferase
MVVGSAPTVGEHTRELLNGLLGYSDEQVEALVDAEVISCDDSD